MNASLLDKTDDRVTTEAAVLERAVRLFRDQRGTLGQAAAVAGLSQPEFLHALGERRIPVHYDEADALADIETVRAWPKP